MVHVGILEFIPGWGEGPATAVSGGFRGSMALWFRVFGVGSGV